MKISMLKPGRKFMYGGVCWVKLDSDRAGTLAIAAESVYERKFDKDAWNYWTASLLRRELNREFIINLIMKYGQWKHFVPMNIDLTAKDGMKDYSDAEDSISLLTKDIYLQYKDLIPNTKESYWTVTPWSCKDDYLDCVCAIDTNGRFVKELADEAELGVRPVCKLKNTLHIEIV